MSTIAGMHTADHPHDWAFPTGDYVRKLRRVADLSQRELAEVTSISRSLIERIEGRDRGSADRPAPRAVRHHRLGADRD
jgi:ribosome-binding protein aMBF1 (putative translation factor)